MAEVWLCLGDRLCRAQHDCSLCPTNAQLKALRVSEIPVQSEAARNSRTHLSALVVLALGLQYGDTATVTSDTHAPPRHLTFSGSMEKRQQVDSCSKNNFVFLQCSVSVFPVSFLLKPHNLTSIHRCGLNGQDFTKNPTLLDLTPLPGISELSHRPLSQHVDRRCS